MVARHSVLSRCAASALCAVLMLAVTAVAGDGWLANEGSGLPSSTSVFRAQSPARPSPAGIPDVGAGSSAVDSLFPALPKAEPKGIVLGVEISGNKTVPEVEIRRQLKTRKDRAYNPQLVQEDLRRLYATRKFHNVRVQKKVVPTGIYITFEVLERPMIEDVLFVGNQYVTDKKLLKESGLSKGATLNVYAIQEARRKVEEYYQSKGFNKTVVTVAEGNKPTDRRVVLRIDEGRLERIWTVRFVGNDPHLATDARLKTLIKSKPGYLKYLFRGKVNLDTIEEDRQLLTAYYRGLGYFQARVSRELDYDSSGQWVTLTFVIDEGPRYRIRNMSIVGNESFDVEQLKERLNLSAGDYFNLDKMQRDQNTLLQLYGSHGHIFADVKASPQFLEEPGQLDLVYHVKEGGLFRVGKINIHVAGEFPHTRRNVVLNRLSLRPGDIVDIREVKSSERRLKASQLFVTSPAEGNPPRIVIRPPNLEEAAEMAKNRTTYRGQSPDSQRAGGLARDVILEIYLPPFRSGSR